MVLIDKIASINLREEYNKRDIQQIIATLEADLVV
jgi:hypothetical protein